MTEQHPPDYRLPARGVPLERVGLDSLIIRLPDGSLKRFSGVAVGPGETILGAIWRTLPRGSAVYADMGCYWRDEYAVLH